MKKSLVALAALAVAGVASAQSSVTLSGTLDAGLEKISGGELQLQNSRNGTTQITVAGVEDLGGGLKARFQISTAFDSTFENGGAGARSGVPNTATFNNLGNNGMFLALDGGFGSLILGRPLNTLYSHSYTANGTKGVTGFAATSSIDGQGIYTANAIQYVTPNLAGLTAQFEYAPSEVDGRRATTSVGLKYASGPFGASLVWDRQESLETVARPRIVQLAGFWDFGVAKLSGTIQDASNVAGYDDKSWVVGLNVPVGPGQFWVQYGSSERTVGGVSDDANTIGLGYKYSLSKRTTAYVNLGKRNDHATLVQGPSGVNGTGNSGFGLGIQHNF